MRKFKFGLIAAGALLLVLSIGPSASAFHDGGVAHCDGCHSMHFSVDGGLPMLERPDGSEVPAVPSADLTLGTDPSSTCLSCHNGSGSYHVNSADGSNYSPGGDFFWTRVTFELGARRESRADNHGHNVVAADFGMQSDEVHTVSPGGSYPAAALSCASCHDPHGQTKADPFVETKPIVGSGSYGDTVADPATEQLGNYRLLKERDGVVPVAVAPEFFGGSTITESDTNHVDYGQNMSQWCGSCHGNMHNGVPFGHPSGVTISSDERTAYNIYLATGDLGATPANQFFALVPIERGATPMQPLAPDTTYGADSSSQVMCLTCHRAHASAFNDAGRWDFRTEFLAESVPGEGDDVTGAVSGQVSADLALNAYYGRDIATVYGEFQRSLCNKCHLKD